MAYGDFVGIRRVRHDRRVKHSNGRPHTVVVFDRVIRAHSPEEMGHKLRLPVIAFTWSKRIDDGGGIGAYQSIRDEERIEIAHTLESMLSDVRVPPEPNSEGIDDL